MGSGRSSGEGGMLNVRESVVGDGADGVLELGARHADIDELRAHGFELCVGLGDVDVGGDAAVEKALGQIELVLRSVDGVWSAA